MDSYITVFVRAMSVNVRLGLHDHEKQAPQRVLVSVELMVKAADYLRSGTILDYDAVHRAVKSWESRPHVELIETYIRELLDLSFGFELVQACRVAVSKPDIYADCESAGAEAFMTRAAYAAL